MRSLEIRIQRIFNDLIKQNQKLGSDSVLRQSATVSSVQNVAPSVQIPASRVQRPGSSVRSPASRVQSQTSRVQRSVSSVQCPRSIVQCPGSSVQDPASRAQRPQSNVQHLRPESRNSSMLNVTVLQKKGRRLFLDEPELESNILIFRKCIATIYQTHVNSLHILNS